MICFFGLALLKRISVKFYKAGHFRLLSGTVRLNIFKKIQCKNSTVLLFQKFDQVESLKTKSLYELKSNS